MAKAAVIALIAGTLFSAGCGSSPSDETSGAPGPLLGGQTGGEAHVRCTSATPVEALAADATSELGFSAAQVLAQVAGERTLSLAWSDGSETRLRLTLMDAGEAGYARACAANEVDVSVSLETDDGALAEAFDAKLFAPAVDQASLSVDLGLKTLHGTLAARLDVPPNQNALSIHLDFAGAVASGGIETVDLSATESTTPVATF